jgi:Hemerythrin HHE cation binding domain
VPRRVVPDNPPGLSGLRRDVALVPLSRDHHAALVQALDLRRAGEAEAPPDPPAEAARRYLDFYETELLGHFADEEEVLLPRAGRADPEGAARIRVEHRELHRLTSDLRSAAGPAEQRSLMRRLGELIHDHVRFEERAFFQRVQAALGGDELAELGREMEAHRLRRGRAAACSLPRPPGAGGRNSS